MDEKRRAEAEAFMAFVRGLRGTAVALRDAETRLRELAALAAASGGAAESFGTSVGELLPTLTQLVTQLAAALEGLDAQARESLRGMGRTDLLDEE